MFLDRFPTAFHFLPTLRALLLVCLDYVLDRAVVAKCVLHIYTIFTEQGSTIDGVFYKQMQHSSGYVKEGHWGVGTGMEDGSSEEGVVERVREAVLIFRLGLGLGFGLEWRFFISSWRRLTSS